MFRVVAAAVLSAVLLVCAAGREAPAGEIRPLPEGGVEASLDGAHARAARGAEGVRARARLRRGGAAASIAWDSDLSQALGWASGGPGLAGFPGAGRGVAWRANPLSAAFGRADGGVFAAGRLEGAGGGVRAIWHGRRLRAEVFATAPGGFRIDLGGERGDGPARLDLRLSGRNVLATGDRAEARGEAVDGSVGLIWFYGRAVGRTWLSFGGGCDLEAVSCRLDVAIEASW